MSNEKRLIYANEFWNRLQNVVYDIFTAHEKDGKLTGTASVGYYTETIQEVLKQTKTVDAVEVVRIEETKQEILQTIDVFIAEYRHISQSSIDHFGGKADAMETARRLVNAALTDLCTNRGAKMDG